MRACGEWREQAGFRWIQEARGCASAIQGCVPSLFRCGSVHPMGEDRVPRRTGQRPGPGLLSIRRHRLPGGVEAAELGGCKDQGIWQVELRTHAAYAGAARSTARATSSGVS